jgi:hypothetical protein
MNTPPNNARQRAAFLGAGLLVLSALLVVTVFGWLHFGSSILLDMAATGLSWCF